MSDDLSIGEMIAVIFLCTLAAFLFILVALLAIWVLNVLFLIGIAYNWKSVLAMMILIAFWALNAFMFAR